MMRIAILGAGFAGLATAWHLLNYTKASISIDLYDPKPIGHGASGISSGLLHAHMGKRAQKSWLADRGMRNTHRLITVASQAINSPLVLSRGVLRPAVTAQQILDFQEVANENADVEWWDKPQAESKVQGLSLPNDGGGIFEKKGLTIHVPLYLEGLWQACALLGTQWHRRAVVDMKELERYECVLIALGSEIAELFHPMPFPIELIKGQILELKWPEKVPPLPFSLVSGAYLVMNPDGKSCLAGATFERKFSDILPHKEAAHAHIVPKIQAFFPPIQKSEVIGCRVGVRVSTHTRIPMAGKLSDKFWIFTGLGSKGLLYHALLGKLVARSLIANDIKLLPEEVSAPIVKLTSDRSPRQS